MWKVQTGERTQLWYRLIILNQDNGQCFIPPIADHQEKYYTQYLQFNIPIEFIVQHTPYRFMDRYIWIKSTNQFSTAYGASPINIQILLIYGDNR